MSHARNLTHLLGIALRRPLLAALMLRTGWRFRRRGWYRRVPFLPVPPTDYLRWRLETAYGDASVPQAPDVERYLRWVVRMGRERA